MMSNIINIQSICFVEYVVNDLSEINEFLEKFDFKLTEKCEGKYNIYQQNQIILIVNFSNSTRRENFYGKHGPSVKSLGLIVNSIADSLSAAAKLNYQLVDKSNNIYGFDGVKWHGELDLFFIDSKIKCNLFKASNVVLDNQKNKLIEIDHVAINVFPGNTNKWLNDFKRLFGMVELKQFHIKGNHTKFTSQALINKPKTFRIVINESNDTQSQITEHLKSYQGEGVQHIAFSTDDICSAVHILRKQKVKFMDVPDAYYDQIDARLPNHRENISQLKKANVLIDGDQYKESEILLQIFTNNMIGPIFFELIQRKGDQGFGAGNIKALYESVERDQIARGVLTDRNEV